MISKIQVALLLLLSSLLASATVAEASSPFLILRSNFFRYSVNLMPNRSDLTGVSMKWQSRQIARVQCKGREILESQSCPGDTLDAEEQRLYEMINQYRNSHGLPPIPLSPSLTLVANRHVLDLAENIGTLTHGWSNCPYNSNDPQTWSCMWEAPQRLGTSYPGRAYENAHATFGMAASAKSALSGWQNSPPHNAVILNQRQWNNRQWKAMGIGIYKGFAVLWVGEESDPASNSSRIPSHSARNNSIDTSNNRGFQRQQTSRRIYPEQDSDPRNNNTVRLFNPSYCQWVAINVWRPTRSSFNGGVSDLRLDYVCRLSARHSQPINRCHFRIGNPRPLDQATLTMIERLLHDLKTPECSSAARRLQEANSNQTLQTPSRRSPSLREL